MHAVVLITVPDKKTARRITEAILKDRLAACVNIVDKVSSFFWWQGKIDSAQELLLVAKTQKKKLAALVKKVKSLHGYSVPEIIALPISKGYLPYLKWIDESLG